MNCHKQKKLSYIHLLPSSASTFSPVESWVSISSNWSSHPATRHPQEKLKRALEISQTISIQFLLSRQCLDSVWTVSRHSLDSVWAVYRQCPDSVSTVSERCSIHPQENLKQAWEKSQTMSRQCLDCVWTVSGQCLEAVWKVFETEALAHTFFAKLSPSGLRRTLLPSSAPVPAKPSSSFAGLR